MQRGKNGGGCPGEECLDPAVLTEGHCTCVEFLFSSSAISFAPHLLRNSHLGDKLTGAVDDAVTIVLWQVVVVVVVVVVN